MPMVSLKSLVKLLKVALMRLASTSASLCMSLAFWKEMLAFSTAWVREPIWVALLWFNICVVFC